jgi:hypothetical protein
VVDGGGGASALSLRGGRGRGPEIFLLPLSHFASRCFVPLPLFGGRVDGEPFGIGFCSRLARMWFEIHEEVNAQRTRRGNGGVEVTKRTEILIGR